MPNPNDSFAQRGGYLVVGLIAIAASMTVVGALLIL